MTRNLHKDNSNVRYDDCEQCFYCDMPFGNIHHEHDHAPIPEKAGGTQVVSTCTGCHDLKDRYSFKSWNATIFAETTIKLFKSGRLADFSLQGGLSTKELPTEFPENWESMDRYERIAWAKMTKEAHLEPSMVPVALQAL